MSRVYESSEALARWSQTKPLCACCWIDHREAEWRFVTGLQTHHLIRRSRVRCDRPWNLLRLCERCHRLAEGERVPMPTGGYYPRLELGHCLWLKRLADPEEWRPERLLALAEPWALPALLPVPKVFADERARRQGWIDVRDL